MLAEPPGIETTGARAKGSEGGKTEGEKERERGQREVKGGGREPEDGGGVQLYGRYGEEGVEI